MKTDPYMEEVEVAALPAATDHLPTIGRLSKVWSAGNGVSPSFVFCLYVLTAQQLFPRFSALE